MANYRQMGSEDWAAKLEGIKPQTKTAKQEAVDLILRQTAHDLPGRYHRLGKAMVGPIQIRLRWEGVARNILVEDVLTKGPNKPYELLDDVGQAYIMNQIDAEVKITPFEGKIIWPEFFRIAAFPRVRKDDEHWLTVDVLEHAQDETRQSIMMQEDARLIAVLTAAISGYQTWTQESVTLNIGANNPIEFVDFHNLKAILEQRRIDPNRILLNPADARDIYMWDGHVTGWSFKDDVFAGSQVQKFGEFEIHKSLAVPRGQIFLLPEPNWLGVMPIKYGLDVVPNDKPEQFYKGWVFDELISLIVLNPRGMGLISKS